MYVEDGISINKTDNGGYLITVRVRRKKSAKGTDLVGYPGEDTKTHAASTKEAAIEIVEELMEKLQGGYIEEDAYKAAFKEGE